MKPPHHLDGINYCNALPWPAHRHRTSLGMRRPRIFKSLASSGKQQQDRRQTDDARAGQAIRVGDCDWRGCRADEISEHYSFSEPGVDFWPEGMLANRSDQILGRRGRAGGCPGRPSRNV